MSDGEVDGDVPNEPNRRVLRNRRYKRPFEDNKTHKRLFTPEIKRHLKTWLIRRRENPYPNREEKKALSAQTGLTYIQICNWFANWRRKLKNAGKNINKLTWSSLIKSYNSHIVGNLEHLSISSDDSIWEETERHEFQDKKLNVTMDNSSKSLAIDHSYTSVIIKNDPDFYEIKDIDGEKNYGSGTTPIKNDAIEPLPQCFQISSTTDFIQKPKLESKKKCDRSLSSNRRAIRKYLERHKRNIRDRNWNYTHSSPDIFPSAGNNPLIKFSKYKHKNDSILLSKWRRSIACFRPSFNRYLINNSESTNKQNINNINKRQGICHGKEELDAAEALTSLSRPIHSTYN